MRLQTRFILITRCGLCIPIDDDDKFTPTKHLTPPPHHSSSRPAYCDFSYSIFFFRVNPFSYSIFFFVAGPTAADLGLEVEVTAK